MVITEPEPATVRVSIQETLDIYEAAQVRSLAENIKPVGVKFIVEDLIGVIETLPVIRG